MDVKLTVFPEHMEVEPVEIEIVGVTTGFTVMVVVLDVTVAGDAQI